MSRLAPGLGGGLLAGLRGGTVSGVRSALLLTLALTLGCQAPFAPLRPDQVIDLSHAYDADTVYWPTEEGFVLDVEYRGLKEAGFWYESNTFRSAEHGGTHIDAPCHFAEGRLTLDRIPLTQLMAPGALVDVERACAADRDYRITVADLLAWESEHGRLPEGAIVLFRTGFGRFWPDRVRYMGTDERGAAAVAKLHFPGLHPDAAAWLVANRAVGAVGLDTPSIDHGPSATFETHRILFEADVPALENVANLDEVPASGFFVIALPMKIRGGSGGPVRLVAIRP